MRELKIYRVHGYGYIISVGFQPSFSISFSSPIEKEIASKVIYSDKKYEPGQTALEQILQISRIEDKYHEIGIYTEDDFWEAVFESAEAIKMGFMVSA